MNDRVSLSLFVVSEPIRGTVAQYPFELSQKECSRGFIWRQHHANVECTLVRGNHDSRAGDPPPSLAISVVDEPYLVGPFAACHYPQAHASHAVLAGHTHPVVRLQGPARDRLSLPCFVFEDRSAILPAFGEFTGGYIVTPQPGLLLFAAGGQSVWRLPSARGLIASSKDMAQR